MWRGLVLLTLWGCNPYRRILLHSEIVEVCPGGGPERAALHFEKQGTFDWRYPDVKGMKRWHEGDDESWTLQKDRLTVSWNNGYAVSTYQMSQKGSRFPGTSTKSPCAGTAWLERVGERDDR